MQDRWNGSASGVRMALTNMQLQMPTGAVQGDVIGCTLDMDAGTVSFARNGQDLGHAYDVPQHLQRAALYPAVCLKNGEVAFNFGQAPLRYQPPQGATPLQQLPASSLVSGEYA